MKGTFRHYKGKHYRAIGLAKHSETGQELVVYETLYPSGAELWARPRDMFAEDVSPGTPRFAPDPGAALGEDFLKNWLAAWSGNRPEVLLAFYHPEIFYSDPAHPEGIQGKGTLRAYLTKLLERYPHWNWELLSTHSSPGGIVFVEWKARMDDKEVKGLDLVQVKDGLIIRNQVYFDPHALI